jgi:hypothetical protein
MRRQTAAKTNAKTEVRVENRTADADIHGRIRSDPYTGQSFEAAGRAHPPRMSIQKGDAKQLGNLARLAEERSGGP